MRWNILFLFVGIFLGTALPASAQDTWFCFCCDEGGCTNTANDVDWCHEDGNHNCKASLSIPSASSSEGCNHACDSPFPARDDLFSTQPY